jgi:hypothetical protein
LRPAAVLGVDGEICRSHEAALGINLGRKGVYAARVDEFNRLDGDGVRAWWRGNEEGLRGPKEQRKGKEMHYY